MIHEQYRMSRADRRVYLIVTKSERDNWRWQVLVGNVPLSDCASDSCFISRQAAQAAGRLARQRAIARQEDEWAFDKYSNLPRGTPGLDRKLHFFVCKRIDRLLRAAAICRNVDLRSDLVRMAGRWMRQQPDGRQPDGRQPDGRQPDGSQPDGSQPDGRHF